jgi:hypothetical protein
MEGRAGREFWSGRGVFLLGESIECAAAHPGAKQQRGAMDRYQAVQAFQKAARQVGFVEVNESEEGTVV